MTRNFDYYEEYYVDYDDANSTSFKSSGFFLDNFGILNKNRSDNLKYSSNPLEIIYNALFWFHAINAVVAFLTNLFVIFRSQCCAKTRSTVDMLMTNVAVIQLIYLVFCFSTILISIIFDVDPQWIGGRYFCKINNYFLVVVYSSIMMTYTFLIIDRFCAKSYGIDKFGKRTEFVNKYSLSVLWFFTFLLVGTILVLDGPFGHILSRACGHNKYRNIFILSVYLPVTFLGSAFVPLMIFITGLLVVVFSCSGIKRWCSRNRCEDKVLLAKQKNEKFLTGVVLVVVLTYFVIFALVFIFFDAVSRFRIMEDQIEPLLILNVACGLTFSVIPTLYLCLLACKETKREYKIILATTDVNYTTKV